MSEIIIPVILCGGSGTRLWPASREDHPKQFLKLMGDFTLLQETARRALRISGAKASNLVTITLDKLKNEVRDQMQKVHKDAAEHIICEPHARNTAAAVAFAAHYVKATFGDKAMMWILPADHHISDEKELDSAFHEGLSAARKDYLVTFGITPTRPDIGYGYIQVGEALMGKNVNNAQQFVEKPDRETAQNYVDAGDYLWNSGMFLFSVQVALNEFNRYSPEIMNGIVTATDGQNAGEADPFFYNEIPETPFDKAVMEKSLRVAVVPCNPAWSDIGSWESLWEIRKKNKHGNVLEGRVASHGTRNSFIQAKDRLIAVAGLENIVVVDTGDAILIADRTNPSAMKAMVKRLKKVGAAEVMQAPPTGAHVLPFRKKAAGR